MCEWRKREKLNTECTEEEHQGHRESKMEEMAGDKLGVGWDRLAEWNIHC
jgi:hypothetical protein